MGGSKPAYILCAVELNYRLVNFTMVNDLSAETTADALFTNIFSVYGSAATLISDRSKSFINDLSTHLRRLGSISHRCVSAYHPAASIAESLSVRVFSSAIRSTMWGKSPSEMKKFIKYVQFLCNNLLTHPYKHSSPFYMLTNTENSFYHPVMVKKDATVPFSKFWDKRMEFMQTVAMHFRDKYDLYLSQLRPNRATVDSKGWKEGQLVWIRIFKYAKHLKHLKSILPKVKMARVKKIVGATALILEDIDTGKLVSRHLSDVFDVQMTGSFGNLYKDALSSQREEMLEDFGGVQDPKQIPVFDAAGKDNMLLENKAELENRAELGTELNSKDKEQNDSLKANAGTVKGDSKTKDSLEYKKRLRPRKPVNYKV